MKNKILVIILVVFIFVGCTSNKKEEKKITIKDRVEDTLSEMTIDEKIGQMITIYYNAPSMDSTLKKAIEEVRPGGFILFSDNMSSYDGTLKFIKDIKELSSIPMFISIDQEGGIVQRLLSIKGVEISNIPSMYEVGLKNDLELTYEVGKLIAEELRVFGINMDYAPVIDVYSNTNNTVIGKRAFGTTAQIVSNHGLKLAKGLSDNGVIPVFKHFPGHGNTETDSHYDLPVVTKTKEELKSIDLVPFIDAINNDAKVIMVGHLAVPSITNDNTPASLSKKLVTGFLKDELNYKGLVVTDALNMGALTKYYPKEEICGKAVEAGVDILLMPTSSRTCLKSVKDALNNKKITEEQINESVRKILTIKYENIEKEYNNYLNKDYLNSSEHQNIIDKIKG